MKWHKPIEKRPLHTYLPHQVVDAQPLGWLCKVPSPSHSPRMLIQMTTWCKSQHSKSAATRDSPLSIWTWQASQVCDVWLLQVWLSEQLRYLQLDLMCADLATVSLCPSQHLGASPKYPADQNQLMCVDILCSSLSLLTVSLSIHFNIVPLWMVLYSFGFECWRCFSILVGDQWVLHAASSIAGHKNGWYQLVCLLWVCFAPPRWPLCFSFHADPLREISARSSSSDGLLVSLYSTCWLIRKLNVSFLFLMHFINVFFVLLRLRILLFL